MPMKMPPSNNTIDWSTATNDGNSSHLNTNSGNNKKSSSTSSNILFKSPMTIADFLKHARGLRVSTFFDYNDDRIKINNFILTLHSTITVLIILISTMFVTMKQQFGEPIECTTIKVPEITQQQFQQFCWMEGVFTVSNEFNRRFYSLKRNTVTSIANNGVNSIYQGVRTMNSDDVKFQHKYYQWVYFVLWIQAFLFYVPRHMWKIKEDRRIQELIRKLRSKHIVELLPVEKYCLVQDFVDTVLISNNYFYFMVMCEVICMVNLIAQFIFTDIFLGGSFKYLGLDWLQYNLHATSSQENYDPLVHIFPRIAKCTFKRYGVTGTIEHHDGMCFMFLNIVNEKIYMVLWFWYILLFFITLFHLIFYRMMMICFPCFRFYSLRSLAPTANKRFIKKMTYRVGNWFILSILAKHLRPYYFRDLIDEVVCDFLDEKFKPHNKTRIHTFFGVSSPPHLDAPDSSEFVSAKKSKGKKGGKNYNDPPKPGFHISEASNA